MKGKLMFGKIGWSSKCSIADKKKMIELIPLLQLVIVWLENCVFMLFYGHSQEKKPSKKVQI